MGDVDFWHDRGIGTYTTINSVLRGDESLENEYQDIRNLAKIYNRQDKAEEIIADIEKFVDQGKQAAEGGEPQRILIAEKWEGEYDIYQRPSLRYMLVLFLMRKRLPFIRRILPWPA